jgi:hypothetical protein
MKSKYPWRLTFNVTHEEYSAFLELARKARTSPSALGQYAINRVVADAENAIPLIPAASSMPQAEPHLVPAGSFSGPMPEVD